MKDSIYYKMCVAISVLLFLFFSGIGMYDIFVVKAETKINNIYDVNCSNSDNYVFLGDSLTQLYSLDDYYENLPLINSGQAGNTTNDILNNLDDKLYKYNPTKVFLLIGINDMGKGVENDIIYKNIVKIIKNIQNHRPTCEIYVESLYPINDSNNEKISRKSVKIRKNSKVVYINNKLKKYCSDNNITYIDVNKELLDENNMLKIEYTVDGVHLTSLAYIKITNTLLPYMNGSLK